MTLISSTIAMGTGCKDRNSVVVNATETYHVACARCHGSRGTGVPSATPDEPTPRDFTDTSWQASMTDAQLEGVVRSGKGAMPAFGEALNDTEISAAVASVRGFAR